MHEALKSCGQLTEQLLCLSRINPQQISDEQYEEITTLLAKREQLFAVLQKPSTDEEKAYTRKIMQESEEMNRNFITIKRAIQMKIRDLKKKDQSTKSYLGYNTIGADSYFYDKRK